MPIYDYRCSSCGNQVEVIHSIDGSGPTECDVCGSTMRKALSAPAIHFKGSGWAKKDAQAASKKTQSSKAKSDASSSTKDSSTANTEKKAATSSDAGASDSKPAAPSTTAD